MITKEEIQERMAEIEKLDFKDDMHIQADDLLLSILEKHGYKEVAAWHRQLPIYFI